MIAGKFMGIITGLALVGLLGAAIANPEFWSAFAGALVGFTIFWFGYAFGFMDGEDKK